MFPPQTRATGWVNDDLFKSATEPQCLYLRGWINGYGCICILNWIKTKYFTIQTTHFSFKNSSSCYVLSPFSVSWEFSDNVRFNEENRLSSKVTLRSPRLSWALNSNSSRQIFIITCQSRHKWILCSKAARCNRMQVLKRRIKNTVLMVRDAEKQQQDSSQWSKTSV